MHTTTGLIPKSCLIVLCCQLSFFVINLFVACITFGFGKMYAELEEVEQDDLEESNSLNLFELVSNSPKKSPTATSPEKVQPAYVQGSIAWRESLKAGKDGKEQKVCCESLHCTPTSASFSVECAINLLHSLPLCHLALSSRFSAICDCFFMDWEENGLSFFFGCCMLFI